MKETSEDFSNRNEVGRGPSSMQAEAYSLLGSNLTKGDKNNADKFLPSIDIIKDGIKKFPNTDGGPKGESQDTDGIKKFPNMDGGPKGESQGTDGVKKNPNQDGGPKAEAQDLDGVKKNPNQDGGIKDWFKKEGGKDGGAKAEEQEDLDIQAKEKGGKKKGTESQDVEKKPLFPFEPTEKSPKFENIPFFIPNKAEKPKPQFENLPATPNMKPAEKVLPKAFY